MSNFIHFSQFLHSLWSLLNPIGCRHLSLRTLT